MPVTVDSCLSLADPGWLGLREALWPHCPRDEHLAEMALQLAAAKSCVQFVARGEQGLALGLAEAALRSDPVNGAHASPVAFLEGLYVAPEARRQGVAKALVGAVADWAMALGCRELASDALLDNRLAHAVHRALGFAQTERVVFFRKELP